MNILGLFEPLSTSSFPLVYALGGLGTFFLILGLLKHSYGGLRHTTEGEWVFICSVCLLWPITTVTVLIIGIVYVITSIMDVFYRQVVKLGQILIKERKL